MVLSVWTWLAGLFGSALRYLFTCVVCALSQYIEATSPQDATEKALRAGWRGPHPGEAPGWRCPLCAGRSNAAP